MGNLWTCQRCGNKNNDASCLNCGLGNSVNWVGMPKPSQMNSIPFLGLLELIKELKNRIEKLELEIRLLQLKPAQPQQPFMPYIPPIKVKSAEWID